MARVKVVAGFTAPADGQAVGQSFYLRNGVWVLRTTVVPLDKRSEAQMNERAGFAAAAREYAYDFSAATKVAWATFAGSAQEGLAAAVMTGS